jgi:hypothetical protein
MKAFFEDGKIRKVDVLNSVRLIYYPMESDSTLIGMVTAESSELNAFLEDMKLKTVVMKPKTNGVMYPMDQLPPAKMRLDNFGWFDYIRPLNKKDIFNWRGKKAGQELKKTTRGNAPLPNQNLFENNKKK